MLILSLLHLNDSNVKFVSEMHMEDKRFAKMKSSFPILYLNSLPRLNFCLMLGSFILNTSSNIEFREVEFTCDVCKDVLEKRIITMWEFPLQVRTVLLHSENKKAFGKEGFLGCEGNPDPHLT